MSKKLLIAAMIDEYPPLAEFDEVWGINAVYARKHFAKRKLDRLYYFDDHKLIDKNFVRRVNKHGCRVITRWHETELPKSEPYPLHDVVAALGGVEYFTCSVAYCIAHAIYEGWTDITLAGMYHPHDSQEYMHHKDCIHYWLGIAIGMGINLSIHGETMLLKPHLWESKLYGYETNDMRWLPIHTLAGAYKACVDYPVKMVKAKRPTLRHGAPQEVIHAND